jgi:hypothetical protein
VTCSGPINSRLSFEGLSLVLFLTWIVQ